MNALYPSLIAADQQALFEVIGILRHHCAGFHCDVMDNHFVPNLTWGPLMVNAIASVVQKPLWVHLMVERPLSLVTKLDLPEESIVSFHVESTTEVERVISVIKEKKWKASVAISPKTALKEVFPFLSALDQVLVMSVEPGASGQPFIPQSLSRIQSLVLERSLRNLSYRIGVDGAINLATIESAVAAGGQDLAVGSAVFAAENMIAALDTLSEHARAEK